MSEKIEFDRERLALCHLVIDIMRCVHEHYLPTSEPFGKRLESMFIAISVAIGQIERKPFSVSKLAAYMNMPRTTVIRRLGQLRRWGLVQKQGLLYYSDTAVLNSIMGLKCYRQVRRLLKNANGKLSALDTHRIAVQAKNFGRDRVT